MLIATDLQEDVFVSRKSLMSNEPHKAIFDFSEPQWQDFSSEFKEFIALCIEVDVDRRPTVN